MPSADPGARMPPTPAHGIRSLSRWSVHHDGRPHPVTDLGHVLEVLDDVLLVPVELRLAPLLELAGPADLPAGVVDGVHDEVVAVDPVADDHVERRRRR